MESSIDKALDLFDRVARDDGATPLGTLAAAAGLPLSTAYRMIARFEARGLLVRTGKGCWRGGAALLDLARRIDGDALLAQIARPAIRRLARATGRTAHLGVLETDMVTYLVKERGGRAEVLTREAMQLEAYCSAIGKVLLASLSEEALTLYLSSGTFVPLTPKTITDPALLRDHLAAVRRDGFAIDDEEVADGLFCLAVPVRRGDGAVVGALSSSAADAGRGFVREDLLRALLSCADEIEAKMNGTPGKNR